MKWKKNEFNYQIVREYHFLCLFPPLLLTVKEFKINTQLTMLRIVSMRSIEGKQHYLADIILHW